MPIKFRCPHCRQLLGIARAKAGLPVDCPTCGRTVRVPHLDGRVEPLPKPGLNLEDSSLVEALDQVAMIGTLPKEEADEVFAEFEPEPLTITAAAAPARIPVVIEAPPAAAKAPKAAPVPASAGGAADVALDPASAFNELSRLVPSTGPAAFEPRASSSESGTRGWFAGLAAFAIGLMGFGAGYLVGLRSSTPPAATSSGQSVTEVTTAKPRESVEPAAPAAAKPAIRGRITYRTEAGDSKPDTGARILVLPQQRQGEVKLPVTGFRAADSPADLQVALASIRALGGELAVVGDDGSFEAALPAAGAYQVLVISHFQSQPEETPLDPAVKRLLDAWFTRPEQLTGRLRYHLGQVRYSGDAPQLWDHSFDRAS